MKRGLLLLAVCALSSAAYAQAEASVYTREQVLEVFSAYNPAVLETAKNNAEYGTILEGFVSSYKQPVSSKSRFELIAVARNFDNSLFLRGWENSYRQMLEQGFVSGADISAQKAVSRQNLLIIFGRIWANSVQLREMQLSEAKALLKKVRRDRALSSSDKKEEIARLKKQISDLEIEIKSLRKNAGEQIQQVTEDYMLRLEEEVKKAIFSSRKAEEETSQTENLHIKSNHKKPVAK